MSDTQDKKKLRLYYVNISISIRAFEGAEDRSTSCGMYVAAEDRKSARREALAAAVYNICDQPDGTMVITITATREISKEVSEGLMHDWAHARPQAEIDAENSEEE